MTILAIGIGIFLAAIVLIVADTLLSLGKRFEKAEYCSNAKPNNWLFDRYTDATFDATYKIFVYPKEGKFEVRRFIHHRGTDIESLTVVVKKFRYEFLAKLYIRYWKYELSKVLPDCGVYEVWLEGYSVNGQSEKAKRIIKRHKVLWEGKTFQEACFEALYSLDYDMRFYDKDANTYWGRRFFDNEADARKSFG
jgi:hypothetical protein